MAPYDLVSHDASAVYPPGDPGSPGGSSIHVDAETTGVLPEARVAMDGAAGHDHSGGVEGKSVVVDYDNLVGNADTIPWRTDLPAPAHSEGLSYYDKDEHALVVMNDASPVRHQLGQEGLLRVWNGTGATIPDGSAVYMAGVEGVEFRPSVALALANALATAVVLGVSTHDIPNNSFGYVTTWGLVNNLDTSAIAVNSTLFLSPTVAGGFVTTEPTGGNLSVVVAFVVRSHATLGRIFVRPSSSGLISASKFSAAFTFSDQPNFFISTVSLTYVAAGEFIFHGTSNLPNSPNAVKMIVGAASNGSTSGFRIRDVTNNLTIAEVASATTNIAHAILDLGVISQLPAGQAIFEVQFKKNTGGAAQIGCLDMRRT